ncbi:MAG: flavin reductase family protein [Treponema sp.]|jgi:flavin reductase (DIM6/NTAB) family NADH-FMN oxidoreductase RutF|nr:flavin reductase family protein [Treponema sp.]
MTQTAVIPADENWVEKDIRDFAGAPAKRIGDQWMLISSGNVSTDKGAWNTMTASWGGLGILWGKNVAFMFIRPVRHTFAFANANPLFTLSFFDNAHKRALEIAGAKSGRDIDKAAETGLTPIVFTGGALDGAVAFKEATEIIICNKLYTHDFDPNRFLDPSIDTACYPAKDYHRMYIGEVRSLQVNKEYHYAIM